MPGVVRYGRSLSALKSERRTPKVLREGRTDCKTLRSHSGMRALTGLDSVGIPVVTVCRPNSRSLAVSQGKGIDLVNARASGLVQAAELYHAETTILPLRLATYDELRYRHNVVEVNELVPDLMIQHRAVFDQLKRETNAAWN